MTSSQTTLFLINRGYEIQLPVGSQVAAAFDAAGVGLVFPCNRQGRCGKCRIKISGTISPASPVELQHLTAAQLAAGVRLACQTKILGPATLEWPEAVFTTAPEKLVQGDGIGEQPLRATPAAPDRSGYGVAVDLGTTTIAAYLVALGPGRIIRSASRYNPQVRFGADLISRIGHAATTEGLAELNQALRGALRELLAELTQPLGLTPHQISELNLVGNNCLAYLLLKIDPAPLGRTPLTPAFPGRLGLDPAELGLELKPQGRINILPGSSGLIGSDLVAGVWATGLGGGRPQALLDLGTNGEIALRGRDRIVACATAAGPAFEGAQLACGMLAQPGAVIDLRPTASGWEPVTIGGHPAQGICGSGLFRVLVELRNKALISPAGNFTVPATDPNFDPQHRWYYLTPRDGARPVYLTQDDIRQFQLAKAAVRAGLESLLQKIKLPAEKLEAVYLAGAFGNAVAAGDAIFLGLLPPLPLERIRPVGNSAGAGAVQSLLVPNAWEQLADLAQRISVVDLGREAEFKTRFISALTLQSD